MKKILIVIVILLLSDYSISQVKSRTTVTSLYAGIGYKFVFFTGSITSNAYPLFQFSNGEFLREINGFFGVSINNKYAIEFNPSYLYSNTANSDGFYFTESNRQRLFYVPEQSRLLAVPLLARFKFFPFSENYKSTTSKMYLGIGGGAIYINEEVVNFIYPDQSSFNTLGAATYENDFWSQNYELFVGINSFSQIGYGFEVSYRLIPLNQNKSKPLISSVSGNFNSINLSANIIFSF
jgi:hypothetical protein